jgi:hypothetical protein
VPVFGSTILEVAIGLVLIYLLMSLIMTAVQEALSGLFKTRAEHLKRAVLELLQGDTALVTSFYEHPLVAALYRGTYQQAAQGRRWRGSDLPCYIPRDTFAMVLLDLARGQGGTAGCPRADPAARRLRPRADAAASRELV